MKYWTIDARTPLRLSLAGGGTDVEPFASTHGSSVINFGINLFVRGYLRKIENKKLKKGEIHVSINNEIDKKENSLIHRGLKFYLNEHYGKYLTGDLEISIQSPVPPGSGLGASSAMVVTAINLLDSVFNIRRSRYELAIAAFNCERTDLSIAGGFQDHYSSVFGGVANYTLANGAVKRSTIRLSSNFKRVLEDSIILIDLGLTRYSGSIIEDQKNNIINGEVDAIEATIYQKKLVSQMKSALREENIEAIGGIISDSWTSKKRFSRLMTNQSIDSLIEMLHTLGSYGSKIVGAGGGGHVMTVFPMEKRNLFISRLRDEGYFQREFQISEQGSKVWI